jgi:hypothetical protein
MPRELQDVKWASEISAFIGQSISANIEISADIGGLPLTYAGVC